MSMTKAGTRESLLREAVLYARNIRRFDSQDWVRYACWMVTNAGLFVAVTLFLAWGHFHGVSYPGYVWFIPIGTGLFVFALSFDDIGHRTLYKQDLKAGEGHIHQMIVITAVGSVVALCLAYEHLETFRIPGLALIALSFFYSAIDEAMHWYRYFTKGLDRVEMWSHFVAIVGHVLMIFCWWHWLQEGYPGVRETMALISF